MGEEHAHQKRQQQLDMDVLASHLSHLPKLGVMAQMMEEMVRIGKARTIKRHLEPNVPLGTDIPFKFDNVESVYIDNTTNTGAITVQFDNEPLQFPIAASSGLFLPSFGSKQLRINGTLASGSVNLMYLNREMPYN